MDSLASFRMPQGLRRAVAAALLWAAIVSLSIAQEPPLAQAPVQWRDGSREWIVRIRSLADLPEDRSAAIMALFAPSLGFGVLGLSAPPMFGAGLVLGGLLLAPGVAMLSTVERRHWESAVKPLLAIDFQDAMVRALRAQGGQAADPEAPPVRIEFTVNGWGLSGERDSVCFVASADVTISAGDRRLLEDRLLIAQARGSPDAPPPQCASLERMGERNARLVRQSAAEAAAVLAVMCLDRLARVESTPR